MFLDFYYWLKEAHEWGQLSDQDIQEALDDLSVAYDLFEEYVKMDVLGIGHEVQLTLKRLKKEIDKRKVNNGMDQN